VADEEQRPTYGVEVVMAGLWICLTPIVWVLGGAFISTWWTPISPNKGATGSTLLVVPLWWALYFALTM